MHSIVELSVDNILNTAINESGQVFRGLRSASEDVEGATHADDIAEDLLLTEDDKGAMKAHLNAFVSEFYQSIRGYCPEYIVDGDSIGFAFEGTQDCNIVPRISPLIEFYFVYRILAWWYRYRNKDLADNYLLLADDYRLQVLSVIVPKFSTRKLRFF